MFLFGRNGNIIGAQKTNKHKYATEQLSLQAGRWNVIKKDLP